MKRRRKDILVAILMTWILPGFVLGILHLPGNTSLPQVEQTTQTTTAPEMSIAVLTQNGVQNMDLTEYLTGVLLCEMPASFPMEAQKAQAVVARTYALRTVTQKNKHPENAVCTDPTCCQGYTPPAAYNGSWQGIEQARLAVTQTEGEVLLYQGALIDATYFSCSGGRTEAAVAVWGTDVPYLQSVSSPGEELASHYTDSVRFTPAEFADALSVSLQGDPRGWITGITYTQGGGVATANIGGQIFSGTQLRSLLDLRSTDITMKADEDGITVQTRGFGHRVGMSQYGAQAMALEGHDYFEILLHYYAGVQIGKYAA